LEKDFNPIEPKYILSALLVSGIILGLIAMRHRWPWALTAWVCYAVIASPQLGFVQSGPQLVADRYTYIACMPFAVLAGAGMQRLGSARQKEGLLRQTFILAVAAILTGLIVLAVMSCRQTRIWYDNQTLWDRVLKLDPDNYYAYYDRGLLRDKQHDWAGAIADYTNVIRLDTEHAKAYNNRGVLRNYRGDSAGAVEDFNAAVRLAPFSPEAYANRGMIRLSQKDLKGALEDFNKVLEVAAVTWPYRVEIEQHLVNLRKRLNAPK
jgi:hypothetical protein